MTDKEIKALEETYNAASLGSPDHTPNMVMNEKGIYSKQGNGKVKFTAWEDTDLGKD